MRISLVSLVRTFVSASAGLVALVSAEASEEVSLLKQAFTVDLTDLAIEQKAGCDPGDYDGKPSKKVSLDVSHPLEKPLEKPAHLTVPAFARNRLLLPVPVQDDGSFSYEGPMTAKYPLLKQREYLLSVTGFVNNGHADAIVTIERLDPKREKSYCPVRFRVRSSTPR